MIAVVVAQGVAILLLGVLVLGLLRSHAEILKALHDLGAGLDLDADEPAGGARSRPVDHGSHAMAAASSGGSTEAHDISGTLVDGSAAAIAVSGGRGDTLLAFLSTACATCQPFWEEFNAGVSLPGGARLVVVVQDEESRNKLRKKAAADLLVVQSNEAWEAYDVPGSPHFVYVDGESGEITGEGTGDTWEQLVDLIDQAGGGRPSHRTGNPGGVAPLPDPTNDPDHRDNPTRIDHELLASGIGPGHASLYAPVDDEVTGRSTAAADVEAG